MNTITYDDLSARRKNPAQSGGASFLALGLSYAAKSFRVNNLLDKFRLESTISGNIFGVADLHICLPWVTLYSHSLISPHLREPRTQRRRKNAFILR